MLPGLHDEVARVAVGAVQREAAVGIDLNPLSPKPQVPIPKRTRVVAEVLPGLHDEVAHVAVGAVQRSGGYGLSLNPEPRVLSPEPSRGPMGLT